MGVAWGPAHARLDGQGLENCGTTSQVDVNEVWKYSTSSSCTMLHYRHYNKDQLALNGPVHLSVSERVWIVGCAQQKYGGMEVS